MIDAALYPTIDEETGLAFCVYPLKEIGDMQALLFLRAQSNGTQAACIMYPNHRDDWDSEYVIFHPRSSCSYNCQIFADKVYPALLDDRDFNKEDRDRFEGMGGRPFDLIYDLQLVETSELPGNRCAPMHLPRDFKDDGSSEWKYYRPPDVSEQSHPVLRLTRLEHKFYEYLVGKKRTLVDIMHILAGVTKQLRAAIFDNCMYNGTKGSGQIEAERLFMWAGEMDTLNDNWHCSTFRRLVAALFSEKRHRIAANIHPHIEDITPPVMILHGRMFFKVQHFLKMHSYSEFEIEGWPHHTRHHARIIAGVSNIFLFGCIVAVLFPEWARKLHQHCLWSHLIGQMLEGDTANCELFEMWFCRYAAMPKLNKHTFLEDMVYYNDHVHDKYNRLRGSVHAFCFYVQRFASHL